MDTIRADEVISTTLSQANVVVGDLFKADVVSLFSPMLFGVDDMIRNAIENLIEEETDRSPNKLVVVLETTGGHVEAVERIVSVFRRHYTIVEFIIPNYAYSAGTILALSGDEIYMDYYSVLGPIDPQLRTEDGRVLPGLGYITKYNDLIKEINAPLEEAEPERKAQLAFLLKKFDPAQLFHIEQAIEHSKALIIEWLPKYKFKNWDKTDTKKLQVDEKYKKERAERIASALGDASRWHSHGRGISMRELESEEIGVKIKDFGAEPQQSQHIRHYAGLLKDYMNKRGTSAAIHTRFRLIEVPV